MSRPPTLIWLRDDLRLDDHPAFDAANGDPALIVYVHDEQSAALRPLGGAARWWLGRSLGALASRIEALGGRLDILRGRSADLLPRLAAAAQARQVFWTRRYGAGEMALDALIKAELIKNGIAAKSFNGQLLREPWEIANAEGKPFRVFSAFWRRHRALGPPSAPMAAPTRLIAAPWPTGAPQRVALDDLALAPRKPDWSHGLALRWRPGEIGAQARLEDFLSGALRDYPTARDRPDGDNTSMLSPHLRFGEISPRRIYSSVEAALAQGAIPARAGEKFLSEIGWREFSYALLFGAPDLATRCLQPRFEDFPVLADPQGLEAWRRGRTGYPLVDAGMRELWATGVMHNRVRMVAASFLIKHQLQDWRQGEAWFWDTLCDADPANNPASWQWVAGCGADAAPYFRIFNPVLQGQKFDAAGGYVRRWVPELAQLSAAHIHAPWLAPVDALEQAGVRLGETYPRPIVDHDFARRRALAALATLSGGATNSRPIEP